MFVLASKRAIDAEMGATYTLRTRVGKKDAENELTKVAADGVIVVV